MRSGYDGVAAVAPQGTNQSLYTDDNPLGEVSFEDKVKLLAEIDAYARGLDTRVQQVSASISGEWQAVQILRRGGDRVADIRPLVRLNVSVIAAEGDRMEAGSNGGGGRLSYAGFIEPDKWQAQVDEAPAPGHRQSRFGGDTGR